MNKKNQNYDMKLPIVCSFILSKIIPGPVNATAMGDYEEVFLKKLKEKGRTAADIWLWGQILKSLGPYTLNLLISSVEMLKNYLKIAFRNMVRNKASSIINLSGLTLGIVCTILILLWVNHEASYNSFHNNSENIYQVIIGFGDRDVYSDWGPGPLAPKLKELYPEIINAARAYQWIDFPLMYEEKVYTVKPMFADQSFLDIFSFPLLMGNKETALVAPTQIVLSEETAIKYFGDKEPLGKTLQLEFWGRWYGFTVSAVIANVPSNSDIKFDVLVPIRAWENSGNDLEDWGSGMYPSYVMVAENTDSAQLEDKIRNTIKNQVPEAIRTVHLHPLEKVHLYNYSGGGKIIYIYTFTIAGIMILVLACINYVNLTVAQSVSRSKEIGMRKVAGAVRRQIIQQFFIDSAIFVFTASVFAIIIISSVHPEFNNLVEADIVLNFSKDLIFTIAVVVIFTSIFAGIYPALVLSSYRPAAILRSGGKDGKGNIQLGRILVTVQSAISIILIISAIIVYSQLDLLLNRDLGFNNENLINLKLRGSLRKLYNPVRQELLKNPDILSTTMVHAGFANNGSSTYSAEWEGKNDTEKLLMIVHSVDQDYKDTFGIEMVEGRFFSREFSTDASAFVLNETAVHAIGWNNPIGKRFSYMGIEGVVIGVAKDFNFKSLHDEIDPLIMFMVPGWKTDIFLRVNSDNISGTINFLKTKVAEIVPDYPFEFSFLDEDIGKLYQTEKRAGVLIRYGSIIAVIISCLGLLGLASNTVIQKRKEIGIRKTLGGTIPGIVRMITWDFTKWIIASNIIAWPTAWILAETWLSNFAYKIETGLAVFLIAGGISFFISLITVGYHSLKATFTNPVNSLRFE